MAKDFRGLTRLNSEFPLTPQTLLSLPTEQSAPPPAFHPWEPA
jgi:hypothetical protein